jgi:hypothetical protein
MAGLTDDFDALDHSWFLPINPTYFRQTRSGGGDWITAKLINRGRYAVSDKKNY